MKKRVLAVLLTLALMVGLLPTVASAVSGAQAVADKARSYYDWANYSTFAGNGFSSGNWCGDFLYFCASQVGEGSAMGGSAYTMAYNPRSMNWFIANGAKVGYFYDTLSTEANLTSSHKMNKADYTPQIGDIIYYDWGGYGYNGLQHVEIVTAVYGDGRCVTTVGGNTGGECAKYAALGDHVCCHNLDISDSRIVAFARPNYSGAGGAASSAAADSKPTTGTATKTQYRYHRYEDASGEYAVCAYWGNVTYNTTMHLVYSDWLDAPLPEVKQGYVNYLEHPGQGTSCVNAGCLSSDPFEVHRHMDASGKVWYYEETRTVSAEKSAKAEPTPAPVPATAPTPTPTLTPAPTPTPSVTPTPTPEVTATPEPTPTPTSTPTPTPIPALENTGNSGDMGNFVSVNSYREGQFTDVDADDWFGDNVATAYRLGLMKGTGAGVFSPGNNVTLAEAVTLAARLHSIYYADGEAFENYDGGNWYDPYVNYARSEGIISENWAFARPATREEFVHILARALPEDELVSTVSGLDFADSSFITYMADVRLLSGAGVINGIGENGQTYFKPTAAISRAEVAAIVSRMARPETRVGK